MIVVRVELWRYGNPQDTKVLGNLLIANDGTGTAELGNYGVKIVNSGVPLDGTFKGVPAEASGEVKKHDRELPVWELIAKALEAVSD